MAAPQSHLHAGVGTPAGASRFYRLSVLVVPTSHPRRADAVAPPAACRRSIPQLQDERQPEQLQSDLAHSATRRMPALEDLMNLWIDSSASDVR